MMRPRLMRECLSSVGSSPAFVIGSCLRPLPPPPPPPAPCAKAEITMPADIAKDTRETRIVFTILFDVYWDKNFKDFSESS